MFVIINQSSKGHLISLEVPYIYSFPGHKCNLSAESSLFAEGLDVTHKMVAQCLRPWATNQKAVRSNPGNPTLTLLGR